MKLLFASLAFALGIGLANAQGTLVFDQQSTGSVDGALNLNRTPFGQSFTPTLDSIDFLELQLNDGTTASTVAINIRSGSITGTLLGTSLPTTLQSLSGGTYDFFFSNPVSLTPGTKYYFEPVVVSGGFATTETTFIDYAGGDLIYDGAVQRGDMWFREGVGSVPEPSSVELLLIGGGALLWRRRKGIVL